MSNGIQVKSHDTTIIEKRLRDAKAGDIVTYDELSRLLGRDVRLHCLGNVKTARESLEKEEKIVFDTVVNTGYRCMTEADKSTSIDRIRKQIKRRAKKGLTRASVTDFSALNEDQKQKHLTSITQLGVIQEFVSAKGTKKIESKVKQISTAISIGDTVKLFGG